jgi:predicted MFS family arabinose efflux permease
VHTEVPVPSAVALAWRRGRAGLGSPLRALSDRFAAQVGIDKRTPALLLAAVMALNSADQGALGSVAEPLKSSLHLDNTSLGLLAAVSAGAGAVLAVPAGMLTDRVRRVPLLTWSVLLWSVAMLANGFANSFAQLLVARVFLGGVTAASGPVLASLTGDYFPARKRSAAYGYILSGEIVGAGFGLVASGFIAAALGWRAAFWLLAVVGGGLFWMLYRWLREPPRGGGVEHAAPAPAARGSLGQVMRAVLSIRTNVIVIIASAVGYFFFAGLRTFAVTFARGQYGLSQAAVTLFTPLVGVGALAGVLWGGRYADRLGQHGRPAARITVAATAYVVAAVAILPGLLTTTIAVALPVFALGAAALGAANPPLDASRLDVVNHELWGRAEGVRTLLRTAAEACSPLLFGIMADAFGGGRVSATAPANAQVVSDAGGIRDTFLVMLLPLAANGLILLTARRAYVHDSAVAEKPTEQPTAQPAEQPIEPPGEPAAESSG